MSKRALLRTLVALAVLIVAWGGFALFRGSLGDVSGRLDLPKLTVADVDGIRIARPSDTIRVERTEAGWRVDGHAADTGAVDGLIGALADSSATTELVARNPASHARLGVDSAGRHLLLVKGDRVLLDLVIGSSGRSYQSAYVRRAGDAEVYLYRGKLVGFADRGADQWRDHRMAAIPQDSVQSVAISRGSRTVEVRRADGSWSLGNAPADTATVSRLLDALADVRATAFPSEAKADSLDFDRPDRRIAVLGHGGDTLLALAFDSTTGGYWGRRARDGMVFQLDFWRMNQLTPTDSALRATTSGPAGH